MKVQRKPIPRLNKRQKLLLELLARIMRDERGMMTKYEQDNTITYWNFGDLESRIEDDWRVLCEYASAKDRGLHDDLRDLLQVATGESFGYRRKDWE